MPLLGQSVRGGWLPALIAATFAALAEPVLAQDTAPAAKPVIVAVEAEQFQCTGDWTVLATDKPPSSDKHVLFAGDKGAVLPAVTAVRIPQAGRYWLWVRSLDFPSNQPGTRTFTVSVDGRRSEMVFGKSGKDDWTWEPGGAYELAAGPVLVGIHDVSGFYGRADAVLLTDDANLVPTGPLGRAPLPRNEPWPLPLSIETDPLRGQAVTVRDGAATVVLENESLRVEFIAATREGVDTVCPRVSVKKDGAWVDAGADPSAETYGVITGTSATAMRYDGYYPAWEGKPRTPITVQAGNASMETLIATPEAMWNGGNACRCLPRAAVAEAGCVRLEFHPCPAGTLAAVWELRPGDRNVRVQLAFTPVADGNYSLGYRLFFRKPLADVQELLLPMMWHRNRVPSRPYTLLNVFTPTPLSLAQATGTAGTVAWTLAGDPAEVPFEWPGRDNARFGLMIRDGEGLVQPAVYGPVLGTPQSVAAAGATLHFTFRVLVQPGDWYSGFRTVADQVFNLRDYRKQVGVSLTDAVLNMIDLVLDDEHGGWWERGKGFYQIETKNGVTQASPLTTVSLYRLTGDPEMLRRRTLPTLEFMLSRSGAHFSPIPDDTGGYPASTMDGPVKLYGTTTFGGCWEAVHHRTPAFRAIAIPDTGVRVSAGYSHTEEFEEWLALYRLTGDPDALKQACDLADKYVETKIRIPPKSELSPMPFFNLSFVPDWEGLLYLYEASGERRFLDAAVFGAHQMMTGVWSQPIVPDGTTVLHPGGQYAGCVPKHKWWKGPEEYRLGFPRRPGDTPEHTAPAWLASNVGLGFEQPCTYNAHDSDGRMIYQAAWAPRFLRLAAHTGDATFEMYARNATLGRWANYPGYYVVGFTDMPMNPDYPIKGPDVGCLYFHHILPHLAWNIDYLVSEAEARSGGRIAFPFQRQMGYAWFDSRIFGHAPGTVYNRDRAWLWLRRGLVTLDNPAVNFLPAHTADAFLLVVMNESDGAEDVGVSFSAATLGETVATAPSVRFLHGDGTEHVVPMKQGTARVEIPGRGLGVLVLDGIRANVPGHIQPPEPTPGPDPAEARVNIQEKIDARAAVIQLDPGPWNAYAWCTAMPKDAKTVVLHYSIGGEWQKQEDAEYPFEFSVPVADPAVSFRFRMELTPPDGRTVTSAEAVISAMR